MIYLVAGLGFLTGSLVFVILCCAIDTYNARRQLYSEIDHEYRILCKGGWR